MSSEILCRGSKKSSIYWYRFPISYKSKDIIIFAFYDLRVSSRDPQWGLEWDLASEKSTEYESKTVWELLLCYCLRACARVFVVVYDWYCCSCCLCVCVGGDGVTAAVVCVCVCVFLSLLLGVLSVYSRYVRTKKDFEIKFYLFFLLLLFIQSKTYMPYYK